MKEQRPKRRWADRLAVRTGRAGFPALILLLGVLSLAAPRVAGKLALDMTYNAHVIWTEVESDKYAVYLADPDGSNRHRVTTVDYRTTSNQLMALSPDESLIVYVVSAEDDRSDSTIWSVTTTDGSGKSMLLAGPSEEGFPTNPIWSPEGDQIAFICASKSKDAELALWVMAPDGSQQQLITNSSLFKPDISFLGKAYALFWARDGYIYYHNERFTPHSRIKGPFYRVHMESGAINQIETSQYLTVLNLTKRRLLAPAGFRLPFEGGFYVTTGPSCGAHQDDLNGEAIDFGLSYHDVIASEGGVIRHYSEPCGGDQIKLEHPKGLISHYVHLSAREPNNTSVGKGCKVGVSGNSGTCTTGAHLHFAVLDGGRSIWIRDLPGITWYTGDINNPCMPLGQNDGWADGPPATCCCLCSSPNYSPGGSQAIGEQTLPISTVEFPFATSTPIASPTATLLPTSTPTPTDTATHNPTPTLTLTNTPPPTSTSTPTATPTPQPSATPMWTATPPPDTNPPHGSLIINGGVGEIWSLNVALEVEAEDEGSSVAEMRFSRDGIEWSEWESYQPTRAWQLPAQNGSHTVYAQFRDGSGNVSSPSSATITVALNPEKPSSQHYRIQSSVAGIGGGEKTSASYRVQNTAGQPSSIAASPSPFHSSEDFRLFSGYWGATVWPCISGDLDCSCIVDIEDIMFVASRWRCRRGDGCYDERFDLDKDGDIDIVDIMLVVKHWGETCP